RRSHHLRERACAPDCLILFVMENDSGRRFPPAPKSGSAFTPTLPTMPAAVACGYPYVAWVSGCPWPQWLGISVEGILRRRSALVNGRSEEHTSELQSPCNLV